MAAARRTSGSITTRSARCVTQSISTLAPDEVTRLSGPQKPSRILGKNAYDTGAYSA